jgi:hypothetical protein
VFVATEEKEENQQWQQRVKRSFLPSSATTWESPRHSTGCSPSSGGAPLSFTVAGMCIVALPAAPPDAQLFVVRVLDAAVGISLLLTITHYQTNTIGRDARQRAHREPIRH